MPVLIEEPIVFAARNPKGRIDWAMFRDGKQYRLVARADFGGRVESVQSSAIQAAKRLGMRARTMRDGEDLIVQFFSIEKPSKKRKAITKKQPKG